MNSITPIALLEEIAEGTQGEFSSYEELEDKMATVLSKHSAELPPDYSCLQLFEWSRRKNYIIITRAYGLRINVPAHGLVPA